MLNVDIKKAIFTCCPDFLQPILNRVENSEIGYRLAKGTFWSLSGAVISKGLGLASSIIVARTLGKVGFGEIGIIYSTVAMFELFASFGLGVTATKYVAQYRQNDPLRAGRIIILAWMVTAVTGALCAIVLAVFAPWLAVHALAAPHLSGLLRITAISLFITALNASQNGALSGFEAFKTLAACNLIAGILNFPILIAGVLLAGLKGAVLATVVSCSLNWLICHLAVRHEAHRFKVPITFSGCLLELPLLWKFSLPAVLGGMMVTPVYWVCNTMLVNQSNGYSEMGILNAANQWRNLVVLLPNLLLGPVLPILSSALGEQENSNNFKKTLSITQGFMVLVSFPICTGLMFLADTILRIYWKTTVSNESVVFIVLLSVALIQCLGAVTGSAIAAKGKMWLGLAFNLSWAVIYIGLVAVFVSKGGAASLAFGQAIAYICLTVWGFLYIRRDLPEGMLRRVFIGLCLTCLITIVCLLIPAPCRVWLSIPLVVSVSALVIRYLVNSEVRKALRALFMSEKAEII
jgi:O-antigen/teichoic acid export membrane protein